MSIIVQYFWSKSNLNLTFIPGIFILIVPGYSEITMIPTLQAEKDKYTNILPEKSSLSLDREGS